MTEKENKLATKKLIIKNYNRKLLQKRSHKSDKNVVVKMITSENYI
jgi:hypothetical protein